MISKVNDRGRSELVIIRLYDPEVPSALSVRLSAVYEIWLDGAAVDRDARMVDNPSESDEKDE